MRYRMFVKKLESLEFIKKVYSNNKYDAESYRKKNLKVISRTFYSIMQ